MPRFALRPVLVVTFFLALGIVLSPTTLPAQRTFERAPAGSAAGIARNVPPISVRGGTAAPHAEALSEAFRGAADRILPSIVKIRTSTKGRVEIFTALRGLQFHGRVPDREGLGSGVVIDPSGVILTNTHVVRDADEVLIEMHDGTELYAVDYTTDPLSDLAVVRVRPTRPLPAASFGDSDALRIGDWVLAIGHPLELETSVSAGIISAKGRSLPKIPRASFLQTDAAINPGNSGGPLVNLAGEIVGINTAIASQTGGYQGIGFAVPGNLARDVSERLIAGGEVKRAYLGVGIQDLTAKVSRQLLGDAPAQGVLVSEVRAGTPAESAGIRPGDIIVGFANQPVKSRNELQRAVERVPVNSSHPVQLVRFGKPLTLQVSTLEFSVPQTERGEYRELRRDTQRSNSLGFEVENVRDVAEALGLRADYDGVIITRVDESSVAFAEGLRPAQLVLQVRDKKIRDTGDFQSAMAKESLDRGVLLLVRDLRTELDQFVVLEVH